MKQSYGFLNRAKRKLTMSLALAVVLVPTFGLIAPAITMTDTLQTELGDLSVCVEAELGTLSDETTLSLSSVLFPDQDAYAGERVLTEEELFAIYQAVMDETSCGAEAINPMYLLDVSLLNGDTEVTPSSPVTVTFSSDSFRDFARPVVVQLLDDGTVEVLDATATGDGTDDALLLASLQEDSPEIPAQEDTAEDPDAQTDATPWWPTFAAPDYFTLQPVLGNLMEQLTPEVLGKQAEPESLAEQTTPGDLTGQDTSVENTEGAAPASVTEGQTEEQPRETVPPQTAPAVSGSAPSLEFETQGLSVFAILDVLDLQESPDTLEQSTGTPVVMTEYITSYELKYKDGETWVPLGQNEKLAIGDSISFTMNYTLPGGVLQNTNTITYSFTSVHIAVEQAESGTVYNDSNVPVGTYTVATDGTISIVFDSTYRSQNANGSQISGKLTFHAEVQATGSGSGTQETFSYGNSQTFTVDFTNDVPKGDISVDKEISKVEGDIIYYTIEVYSEQGTFGPVEINDRIDDNGGYYYIQNTMTVRDKNSNPVNYTSLAFRDKNGNTSPEESANKGFLMQLPQMGARETYVIDCTVHVNDDNTIDVTDKHLTNDVEAASKNNAGRDIHGKDNVRLDWKLLKKSGTYNADTDSYEYTLTVNEMGTNLNGWQLQDTCNGVPLTNYTATIRDTTTGSTTTVTLPYTFGDHVFAQGDSTHQYTVTYSFASEALYVENNAQMSYTGTGLTVTASTLTGKGDIGEGALSKSGTLGNVILLSNGTPAREVIWTVTLDHADFDIPAGAYFDDSLYKSGGFYKNYYTHDQLIDNATAVVNAVEGQGGTVGSIQVWTWQYDAATGTNGTSGSTTYASLSDLTGNLPQSNQYQAFRVTLDTDLPKGSTPLTFQYTSTLETPSSTSAIYGIQNQFKVSSIPKLDKTASVNLVPSNPSIVKKGMNASGSLVDVEETEINYDKLANVGGNKDNLHWQLMLTVPENYTAQQGVVLEDQVPADLYVVQVEPKTQGTGANHCWYVNNPDGKYGHGTYQSVTRDGNAATLYLHGAGGTVIGDSAGYQVGWDMEITANNLLRITLNEDAIQYLADMQKFYTTGDLYTYSGTWKPATADDVVLTIDIYARNPDLNWQYPYDNRPFENTVVVKDDNGTRMDSDSQTTAVIRDQRKGLLDKRGEALKLDGQLSNTVAYDIAINPGEDNHDLLPYSNELLIADELVFNDHFPCYCGNGNDGKHIDASLVPGSVKLYKVSSRDWKGNPVVEEEVPVTYRYSKWEEAGYKGAIERHKQIELTVEDGFDYHLHYEYKFEGDYGGTIYDLINNITIFGTPGGDTKSDTTVKFNVQDSGAVANTKGAILYKVDASDFGTYLQGAQFEVFRYNPNESPDPYTSMGTYPTDTEGKIELSTNSNAAISFAYNTAYKLVERTPPTGYFLDPTPYEFYIENADTTSYPPCIPANFSGEKLQDGALIYFPDDKNSTSIRVDKFWLDEDENPIDAPAGASITFDLLQDDTLIGTYTANAAGITAAAGSTGTANGTAWSYTISGLPYAPTNTDNTAGTPYKYTVQEASLSGYQASYTNNDGISSGTISIFNQEESDDGYVLPKTGGAGTTGILTAGAALCGLALLGLYRVHVKKKAAAAD